VQAEKSPAGQQVVQPEAIAAAREAAAAAQKAAAAAQEAATAARKAAAAARQAATAAQAAVGREAAPTKQPPTPATEGTKPTPDKEETSAPVPKSVAPTTEGTKPIPEHTTPPAKETMPAPKAAIPVTQESAPVSGPQQAGSIAGLPASVDLVRGKQLYNTSCIICHQTGAAGAPKLGDKIAWIPRLTKGFNALVSYTLGGHKSFFKGSRADIADEDVVSAVGYMVSSMQ
jgi:cytochrome c5